MVNTTSFWEDSRFDSCPDYRRSQPGTIMKDKVGHSASPLCGLSVAMSTTQFIQDNKTRIQNIDGNLDDAAITITGESGRLEFYYFENGYLVSSRSRIHKW